MFFIIKIWITSEIVNLQWIKDVLNPILIILMGTAILFFWILEIKRNYVRLKQLHFNWKNENNERLWFHVSAEILTSLLLLFSGFLLLFSNPTSKFFALFSAGALFYASINSLSWVFAEKSRLMLAIPMIVGIAVSVFVLICCII